MEGRAFLSVSDKTGIVEFAEGLVGLNYEIISTGGTKKALEDAGVPVTGVSEITGFPECLDGRVKTLHPNIHGGILAMRNNADHMKQIAELGIKPIDIVAVNLYPFKQTISKENFTFEEAIENIDIGGPSMLRAAAKNYQDVLVLVDSADYPKVLQLMKGGGIGKKTRLQFAGKVFQATAAYDALIANYLNGVNEIEMPEQLTLTYEKVQDMRYGANGERSLGKSLCGRSKIYFWRHCGNQCEGGGRCSSFDGRNLFRNHCGAGLYRRGSRNSA